MTTTRQKGYIAITTSIILSIIMMVVAIALGTSNFFTRADVNDFYNKQTTLGIARSCLDYALLSLAQTPSYTGNQTIAVSSFSCTINTITTAGANKVIQAHAQLNGTTTNLQLTVNAATLSTVSLEELVHF